MDTGNTYVHGFPLSAYSCTSLQSRKCLVKDITWFYLPRFMSKKWLDWNIQGRELEREV